MWLINAQNQRLEQFLGCDVPKYAILSHTWEHEEVTFQEMSYLHASLTNRKGYRKINHACVRALKDGLQYAWVDTCCIDKSNLAELTESINSMYKWYQNAEICYVYLADLTKGVPSREGFKTCRWFTRGWTLQELIAPKHIRFFDQDWECIGDKEDFLDDLYSATSISVDVLSHKRQPSGFSIATRMSWAARRNTTRMEDLAYCLLGIFDVNMPLIYGEGMKAFRRLQEQILMRSNDLTLLAWNSEEEDSALFRLFALRPADFSGSGEIQPYSRWSFDPEFALTNKGLRINNMKYIWKNLTPATGEQKLKRRTTYYSISLGARPLDHGWVEVIVQLRKVGPDLFLRHGKLLFKNQSKWHRKRISIKSMYICTDVSDVKQFEASIRHDAIHVPEAKRYRIHTVKPESHWDDARQLFFAPLDDPMTVIAASFTIAIGNSLFRVVLCLQYDTGVPQCRIFSETEHASLSAWLFSQQRLRGLSTWDDIRADAPQILQFGDTINVATRVGLVTLTALLRKGVVDTISTTDEVYSLQFRTEMSSQDNGFGRAALPIEAYELGLATMKGTHADWSFDGGSEDSKDEKKLCDSFDEATERDAKQIRCRL